MTAQTQTYETHRHTPTLSGIAFVFLVLAVIAFALRWFGVGGRLSFAVGLAGLIASNFTLIFISRAYTTKLQDRIIRLEMKTRCSTLPPLYQAAFARLSTPQLVALRFASDEELPELIDRSDRERLTADQIKRAVKSWVPDWERT